MLFLESDFSVKILSVQRLSWDFNNTYVKPRPYNAISFRFVGNAAFSDGKKEFLLQNNDILFMPKGVGYHLKSEWEEIIVIHFELEGLGQDYFEVISPKHTTRYEIIFKNIYDIWNGREQGYYFKAMSLFYSLFAHLSNHSQITQNSSYQKIRKSVEYINSNFTDCGLNIDTLCKLSNMSDTYFRKLFFEAFETTPIRFVNTKRVNYAIELLETGYYTVEAVAEKCGFDDPKYFSTVFKKHIGCSPAKYSNRTASTVL